MECDRISMRCTSCVRSHTQTTIKMHEWVPFVCDWACRRVIFESGRVEAQWFSSAPRSSLTNILILARNSTRISESWLNSDRNERVESSFEFSSSDGHVCPRQPELQNRGSKWPSPQPELQNWRSAPCQIHPASQNCKTGVPIPPPPPV
jgi:hypothetical protein